MHNNHSIVSEVYIKINSAIHKNNAFIYETGRILAYRKDIRDYEF